jgi:histidinol-phosphate aminotransferase
MSARFDLQDFLPRHIRKMMLSKTKSELPKDKGIFNGLELDKNISSFGTIGSDANYTAYPDSEAKALRNELSEYLNIPANKICFGNGSDELIDLVMRIFTRQGKDHVLAFAPFENRINHFAALNGLVLDEVALNNEFQLSVFQAKHHIKEETKILYLSNPNPISGVALRGLDMIDMIDDFSGIVIVDETNIGYNPQNSLLEYLDSYPNLIIIQSFSNVWGMAGLRLGALFASPKIVEVINAVKAPFNVNAVAQEIATRALRISEQKDRVVAQAIEAREKLADQLLQFKFVQEIYKSEANYLLVKVDKPKQLLNYLEDERIYIYDASGLPACENTVRISIGNEEQNQRLIKILKEMSAKNSPARMIIKKIGQTLQRASVFLGFFKKIMG